MFTIKVPDDEWEDKHKLALEREMLGLYVSGHPLNRVAHLLTAQVDTAIPAILDGDVANETQVRVGGILASVNRRVNKNGMPWASAQLEDLTGGIEVMFFPHAYSTFGADIVDDAVVLINAKVAIRDDRIALIANELVVPDFSIAQADRPLAVSLPTRQCTFDKVSALKQVLARHPGTSQVHLRLISGDRITTLELDAVAAGDTLAGADGRPQGAARSGLPGHLAQSGRQLGKGAPMSQPHPIAVQDFSHVCIGVSDIEASVVFYTAVLGMDVVFDVELAGAGLDSVTGGAAQQGRMVGGLIGAAMVELLSLGAVPDVPERPAPGLHQRVVPGRRSRRHLRRRSAPRIPTSGPTPPVDIGGVRMFFIYDPDGTPIELLELPAGVQSTLQLWRPGA